MSVGPSVDHRPSSNPRLGVARAGSSLHLSSVRSESTGAVPGAEGIGPEPGPGTEGPEDVSEGEVSTSVRVRHVHIREVRSGTVFEAGEEGVPPGSEGQWSEGEATPGEGDGV